MKRARQTFWLIVVLSLLAVIINLPKQWHRPELNLQLGNRQFYRDLEIKRGLDLQGGTHLVLEADMSAIAPEDRDDALNSAKEIISRRVDLYGVSEPSIQTAKLGESYRIIVELPGIKDIDQAIKLIGQTAQLDFREDQSQPEITEATAPAKEYVFVSTGLTGKDLIKASVNFSQSGENTGQPVVALRFTPEGTEKFGAITQRNVNRPLAIFLDDDLLTAPIVSEAILDGQAVISGHFTTAAATNLAIQLNAGALPTPIKIIEQRNVSATLGTDSIAKSIRAGLVGLSLVMLFMALYYGKNGLIADLALIVYGLLTLSVYRLIPVTLTLPGIAGFILTVGMAVDSNILIFERLKEELRAGRPFPIALELGFGRAWDSIKDANVCTIITSLVLLNPLNWHWLNTSGLVRGFALTLLIGVVISLFTGIVVTRTLMRVLLLRTKTQP
jgi:preprotein translocase subunit SecD